MKTQHEEMIADLGALQDAVAEPLSSASMAAMNDLLGQIADNLALARAGAPAWVPR